MAHYKKPTAAQIRIQNVKKILSKLMSVDSNLTCEKLVPLVKAKYKEEHGVEIKISKSSVGRFTKEIKETAIELTDFEIRKSLERDLALRNLMIDTHIHPALDGNINSGKFVSNQLDAIRGLLGYGALDNAKIQQLKRELISVSGMNNTVDTIIQSMEEVIYKLTSDNEKVYNDSMTALYDTIKAVYPQYDKDLAKKESVPTNDQRQNVQQIPADTQKDIP
ncbi:MAG: hypothetical protein GY928_34260 [Colwellia sp.]|nr:hypothetical protein [Colwellia sp.]